MTEAVLSFDDVTVRYGATRALDGLNLEILGERVTGLVGPNGAGKTTTLRAAAGLVPLAGGRARVLGLDPVRQPVAVRRRMGFLPDRPALPSHLTVTELLHLRAALYGVSGRQAESRLEELDELVGIADLRTSWCGALSHGQAQRVALAAVLVSRPPVILVDEPMTALDLEAQLGVQRVLRRQAEEGAAVVLTTHTVAHVAALADHVVHLDHGRMVGERDGTRDPAELEAWLLAPTSPQ